MRRRDVLAVFVSVGWAVMALIGALLASVRSRGFPMSALCAVVCMAQGQARAQVIEIGDEGHVVVYDRPSVFDGDEARPIAKPPAAPARQARQPYRSPAGLAPAFRQAAVSVDISPALLSAVARQESRFNPAAVSHAGAVGVMQLMPGTARDLGCDPFDAVQNIAGGARYLRTLLNAFGGDLTLALAAYNAGPAAVRRFGGVPPYAETRAYVDGVLRNLSTLSMRSESDGVSPNDTPLLQF